MLKQKPVTTKRAKGKASTSKQEEIKDKSLAYRSSLVVIYNLVNEFKFSKLEIDSLQKLPFWSTLKPFIEGKIGNKEKISKENKVIKKLLETYSVADVGFKIGGNIIKLIKEEIQDVFGIVGGDVAIDLPNRLPRPSTDLANLLPPSSDGQLRYSMLLTALKQLKNKKRGKETEIFADNVAKIVCLMLLSNLFLPSSNPTLKWGWLQIVDDLNQINNFDWAGQILKSLTKSLEEAKGDYALCKGFVPSVLYIFAEHAKEGLNLQQENENVCPRFMRWNSSHLCEKFEAINFDESEIGEMFFAERLSPAKVIDSTIDHEDEFKKMHVLERENKYLKEKMKKKIVEEKNREDEEKISIRKRCF